MVRGYFEDYFHKSQEKYRFATHFLSIHEKTFLIRPCITYIVISYFPDQRDENCKRWYSCVLDASSNNGITVRFFMEFGGFLHLL